MEVWLERVNETHENRRRYLLFFFSFLFQALPHTGVCANEREYLCLCVYIFGWRAKKMESGFFPG